MDLERLSSFYTRYIGHTTRSDKDESRFRNHINELSATVLEILLPGLLLLIVGSWPVEYFLFEHSDVFYWFSLWRLLVAPLLLTFLIVIRLSERLRFYSNELVLLISLICLFWVGYCLARAAGSAPPKSPWFYTVYVVPFLTTPLALSIGKRLLSTMIVISSFLVGYFLGRPSIFYQEYFFSTFIIILGSGVMSVGLGHIIYHLNRTNFFKEEKLEYLATHDLLTELLDRGAFEERLKTTLEQADRYDFPISFLLIDLDHFKEINDSYGHSAGDRVLERFGEILKDQKREADVAGRYGGEEFSVIMPHTDLEEAKTLAERIREEFSQEHFETNEESFQVTCSIGLTEYRQDGEDQDTMVKRADRALYQAKENGRNTIETVA
ncbi:MAG: GGDEF domain-containing protein [bacterium]